MRRSKSFVSTVFAIFILTTVARRVHSERGKDEDNSARSRLSFSEKSHSRLRASGVSRWLGHTSHDEARSGPQAWSQSVSVLAEMREGRGHTWTSGDVATYGQQMSPPRGQSLTSSGMTSSMVQVPVDGDASEPIHVIPIPNVVDLKFEAFLLQPSATVVSPELCMLCVEQLRNDTGNTFRKASEGTDDEDCSNRTSAAGSLRFSLGSNEDVGLVELGEEGYRLDISPTGIVIESVGKPGLFYGCQTLRQLLHKAPRSGSASSLQTMKVEDSPRFRWRGAMLDSARHFMPKDFVLKLIDQISQLKMNSFHWHLTDDQGWRIEIKKYPDLTTIGSRRKETVIGHPEKGYGFDGVEHKGFFSQDDVREVVAYAKDRYVNVVPEIEMPGHSQAAIAAYPWLGNTDTKLEPFTSWGVSKHIYSPQEKTLSFLRDVLDEVTDLFPSQFIHVGGDECPRDEWRSSEVARQLAKERNLDGPDQLQSWIIKNMDSHLTKKGRRLVGWDEILEGGLAPGATVMSWRGIDGGIRAAQMGHDVVMAPADHTYLDWYQSDEEARTETPIANGGVLTLEKVYSWDPVPSQFTDEEAKHVLGAQGQLWTEYMKEPEDVHKKAFPRLSALAEVTWTRPEKKSFDNFLLRLPHHLDRLTEQGVSFRQL